MWRLCRLKLTGRRRCVKIINMAYKCRFLLRLDPFRLLIRRSVATIAPMKRGLKAYAIARWVCITLVATIAPMKRGLKDPYLFCFLTGKDVATIAPMKRGLKGRFITCSGNRCNSSNHCPDEKGTESGAGGSLPDALNGVATIAPMKRGLKVDSGWRNAKSIIVATIAPMKRGLKGSDTQLLQSPSLGSNHCPDEKGTESAVK